MRASSPHPFSERADDLERRANSGDPQAQRHLYLIHKHLDQADTGLSREAIKAMRGTAATP